MSDASPDVNKSSIVNFVASSPTNSFLLNSFDTTGTKKTAEYLCKKVESVITENKLEGRIAGYVSDNCSANVSSWTLIKAKYPKLFAYGCSDHAFHLAAKDLCEFKENSTELSKDISKTVTTCKDISVLFKNNQNPKYELNRLQEAHGLNKLVIPAQKRWGSHLKCVERVQESMEEIKTVSYMPNYIEGCNKR